MVGNHTVPGTAVSYRVQENYTHARYPLYCTAVGPFPLCGELYDTRRKTLTKNRRAVFLNVLNCWRGRMHIADDTSPSLQMLVNIIYTVYSISWIGVVSVFSVKGRPPELPDCS